jgi:hypothetical protein
MRFLHIDFQQKCSKVAIKISKEIHRNNAFFSEGVNVLYQQLSSELNRQRNELLKFGYSTMELN